MKELATLTLCLFTVTFVCDAQQVPMLPGNTQGRIDAIVRALQAGEIVRVEILQIPPGVETRAAVTPGMLERIYHYKLIIRDLRGGAYERNLLDAVSSISVTPSEDKADLRWGIIFYDASERRMGALYCDASGRLGEVDSVSVSLRGDLREWLDSSFSGAFK